MPKPTRITIPATSKRRYLGGMAALNLPSPKGTGDWHMEETFFREKKKFGRSFISGEGCQTNTLDMLGDAGIYDCTKILDDLGIFHESSIAYAASHARAIADLVVSAILHKFSPDFVVLDDWMPGEDDKQEVFNLISVAEKKMTSAQKNMVQEWKTKNAP